MNLLGTITTRILTSTSDELNDIVTVHNIPIPWYHHSWFNSVPNMAQTETLRKTKTKKNIIHQVTIMLAVSKNVLFPGHNHLLNTGTNDSTLISTLTFDIYMSPRCSVFRFCQNKTSYNLYMWRRHKRVIFTVYITQNNKPFHLMVLLMYSSMNMWQKFL